MKPNENSIEDVLKHALPSASERQREAARDRIYNRARSEAMLEGSMEDFVAARSPSNRVVLVAVAAAAILVLAGVLLVPLIAPDKVYAIVETGAVFRGPEGKMQVVKVGDKIGASTPVRTNAGSGAVLKLPDGASIEMNAQSELVLEPTEDGVRVRVNGGSVRVTPSKQPAANLYVQNRESTLPVVGTTLQAAVTTPRDVFDVVSVRPSKATTSMGGERGAEGGGVAIIKGCTNPPRVDPSRFVAINTTLYNLISVSFGQSCSLVTSIDLIAGGPGWIKSDLFDVQATIPDGAFTAPVRFIDPKLQTMLQNMLADRFKLAIRREMRERPIYLLKPNGALKLASWKEGDRTDREGVVFPAGRAMGGYLGIELRLDPSGQSYRALVGRKVALPALTEWIMRAVYRPVVDQTGLTGEYNFEIEYDNSGLLRPTLPDAIQEFGLKLEDTKGMREILVIDSVEKPSEN